VLLCVLVGLKPQEFASIAVFSPCGIVPFRSVAVPAAARTTPICVCARFALGGVCTASQARCDPTPKLDMRTTPRAQAQFCRGEGEAAHLPLPSGMASRSGTRTGAGGNDPNGVGFDPGVFAPMSVLCLAVYARLPNCASGRFGGPRPSGKPLGNIPGAPRACKRGTNEYACTGARGWLARTFVHALVHPVCTHCSS
jgi:hypothetical protein